jgi:tetratricopeptide (TPR) repeat protein/predicted Ser/Thr protein kinase
MLGEGGMGAVYQAWDREVERVVALKLIRPELANNPDILRRFKQELVLARQVTHRNIVRIFDLGVADGLKFITMEFLDGEELAVLLEQRKKLPPREAAEVILQTAHGLEAAHAAGIIHRDLKPQNIMIEKNGRVAVMDFGIAATTEELPSDGVAPEGWMGQGSQTMAGSLLGTPRYMSPEQALGEKADARSDIFTLGVIFYQVLTGDLPYEGENPREIMMMRTVALPKPPIEKDPQLPRPLNDIVMKCLQIEPAQRYQKVSELIEELELWLGLRTVAKRGPWKVIASGLAALLVLAGVLVVRDLFFSGPGRTPAPVKLLIADFQNKTGDTVFDGTLEPMFNSAMEGASFITTYNRGTARKLATQLKPGSKLDESVARLVAVREGLGVVLDGSIERHDNGYQLTTRAVDAVNGTVIASREVDFGNKNDAAKAVAKEAARIRKALGDATPESAQVSAAETFSAGSMEAAQKYAQAQELQWSGKLEDAVAAYKEAIKLDPNMGRAYAGVAANLANLGRRPEAEQYYQQALARIDRMSDREKYRTRGGYYLLERDYQKAIEQFKALEKLYPVDTAGIANLGLAYFYARNMSAALEEGRRAIQIYPNNLLQRNNVGLYAMYSGDFDTAIRESQELIKLNPSFEKAYLCLGLSQLGNGQPAEAAKTYEQMAKLSTWGASEAATALTDLALYEGHRSEAVAMLQKAIAQDQEHKDSNVANKLILLAQAQFDRGQRSEAVDLADRATKASDDESVLVPAALIYIEAGSPGRAQTLAAKLGARFGPDPQAYGKLIEAVIRLKRGETREALNMMQDSQKLADTWLGRYYLGRAYLDASAFPDADNEFDVCLKRRGEATAVFLDDEPSYRYLPPVYYYQGRAREGLKSPGAVDSYKAFVAIKEKADPDPLVADARKRAQAH